MTTGSRADLIRRSVDTRDRKLTQREAAEKMEGSERWVREQLGRMKEDGGASRGAGSERPSIKPENTGRDAETGAGGAVRSGLARFRYGVRRRTDVQASANRGERRDAEPMDDQRWIVEEPGAEANRDSSARLSNPVDHASRRGLRERQTPRCGPRSICRSDHRRCVPTTSGE